MFGPHLAYECGACGKLTTCRSDRQPKYCPHCRGPWAPRGRPPAGPSTAELAMALEDLLDAVWAAEREWDLDDRLRLVR